MCTDPRPISTDDVEFALTFCYRISLRSNFSIVHFLFYFFQCKDFEYVPFASLHLFLSSSLSLSLSFSLFRWVHLILCKISFTLLFNLDMNTDIGASQYLQESGIFFVFSFLCLLHSMSNSVHDRKKSLWAQIHSFCRVFVVSLIVSCRFLAFDCCCYCPGLRSVVKQVTRAFIHRFWISTDGKKEEERKKTCVYLNSFGWDATKLRS